MAEQSFHVRLGARIDGYLAAMAEAKKATKDVANSGGQDFDRLGGKMHDVGYTLSRSVTLPLIAVGGVAVKMSSDFEGAFGRMVGLAGVTADEVEGLKEAVLDLAGETGQAPQDLADGLYFLRSSGLDSAKAMDALRASAMASTAGLGSTAVIADAVSSAMNAYATSGLSAAAATDVLVATARAGKAEPAELAGALGRVLPIASELGITFEDVGGAIAALSLSGNDASTSATLLSNIMSKMLKPSQQGAEALAAVGMSASSIRASIADQGLLGTLEDLKARLGDAGFVKFLEDAQAVQGALALTGQNAEQVATTFGVVRDSAGATGEAFDAMAETSGFKMKKAWAEVQVALIQAGDIIMPIVSGVAGAIGNLASIFADLPGPVQTIVVAFLGLVAAAGPLLMISGSLVRNFKEVNSVMGGLRSGVTAAVGPLAILGVAAFALSQRANHAADEIRKIGEAASALSSVADAEVMKTLWNAISQGVIAGQDLTVTMKQLAEANVDGARRALEMAEAQGASEPILVALRRAIVDKMRADQEAAGFTKEHGAAIEGAVVSTDDLTDSTDDLTVSGDAAAIGTDVLKLATEGLAKAADEAKRKSDLFADSLVRQREKTEELYGIERSAVQSKHDFADSTKRANDDLAKLNETLKTNKVGSEEATTAVDTAAASILKASEDYATLNGATLNSDLATKRQIDSLTLQAAQLAPDSPLRARLLEYIAELARVQTDIQTRLMLNISIGQVSTKVGDIPIGLRSHGDEVVRAASGRFVPGGSNLHSTLGEVSGPGGDEVVLPIGNPSALSAMLSDPRVSVPISAAWFGSGSSNTPSPVNSTNNYNATVNNNNQPVTVSVISQALAMARLAA